MGVHSIAETKARLSEIIDAMASGEPQTITRRGKPVAKLVPADAEVVMPRPKLDVNALRRHIDALDQAGTPIVDTDAFWREWKNEQRY